VITEVGSGVTRLKVGDRVIMDKHFYGTNCLNLELDEPCEMCAQDETNFCLYKSDYPYLGVAVDLATATSHMKLVYISVL